MPRTGWSDYEIFLAVARSGQISRAGQQLGLNHATVGRRIAALEAALKARLFDRSPRGYQLTGAGERLVASAEAMEAAVRAAESEVGEGDPTLTGTVRIGAPDGFGTLFLAPRIGDFCRRHPAVELQIIPIARPFSLSRREADIAIGLSSPEGGRLVSRRLTDYTLGLYATEAYFAERGRPERLEELRRHRGIGYIQDLIFMPEIDYLDEVGSGLRPRITSSSLITQLNAARAGAGLSVLPDFCAAEFPELRPVLGDRIRLRRAFWLVMHEDTRRVARVRHAADFVAARVEAEAARFLPYG
ncbi:LysR family transcriptional regulator [Prosthecomicrobium sp. N25]|uniref:LysR family transcriptional regulator n=1 Tax=Prosthecomicrobium sp. N25 TaxID=3129254 RepID=UPI003078A1BA